MTKGNSGEERIDGRTSLRLRSRAVILLILTAIYGFVPVQPVARGESPAVASPEQALLEQSDRARAGLVTGLTWTIEVEKTEGGKRQKQAYVVKARADNTLIECTAPEKHKGERVLLNGHTLWFYRPGLKRPVAVSSRQKMSGQAANGDIALTNFARDYTVTQAGDDTLDKVSTVKLELKARTPDVTYDQVRYWIARDSKLGVKAEFLTKQGKVFKSATFEHGNKLRLDGREVPFLSRMTIVDTAFPENFTVIEYAKPVSQELPETVFDVANIAR